MLKQMIAGMLMLAATGAGAQTNAIGGLQCKGRLVTIRLSTIKSGQLELFKKAIADHQAWYASHKNGTKVAYIRLAERGSYDDSTAMSVVTYDPAPQPAHDAGYAAFVKEYQDSSSVKDEHRGCMN